MRTAIGKRTVFAASLALALPFGLAACGDDKEADEDTTVLTDESDDRTEEPIEPDTTEDVETTDETEDVETTDETEEVDAVETGSDEAGKPTRDEVRDGVETMLGQQLTTMGITPEQVEAAGLGPAIENFYTCVVDGIYDEVSAPTLQAIAKGDPSAPVMGEDNATLTETAESCVASELEPALG